MSFLQSLFKSKPDAGVENLQAVIAANIKDRESCLSFAKKSASLEGALQKASREFYANPNDDKLLEAYLQARRVHASDGPALKDISAQLGKERQQAHLEQLKEASAPALASVKGRLEAELVEITRRDTTEAQKYGMAPEMSPARGRVTAMIEEAEHLEKLLPTVDVVNALKGDLRPSARNGLHFGNRQPGISPATSRKIASG